MSWWPGNVETQSGLHLHHLVWGISLLIIAGFVGFAAVPKSPWYQITAVLFGIGVGLTLDEFALWVHLEDVYWSNEGRLSLDAVVLVAAFMALVAVGSQPFGLSSVASQGVIAVAVIQALVLATIACLKGRISLGLLAIFIPVVGYWAALRLGKASSPWGHKFYGEEKVKRAEARFPADRRSVRFRNWFFDAIGGKASLPDRPENR